MATFDSAALAALTAKIDQKLTEANKPVNTKKQAHLSKAQPELKRKRQDDKPEHGKKKQRNNKIDRAEPLKDALPKEPRQESKGRKQEKQKPPENQEKKGNWKKGQQKSQPREDNGNDDGLLHEIKALGGDEEDLELVADIDSDNEHLGDETSAKLDKGLAAELAKFASGLGFEKLQRKADGRDGGEDGGESEVGEEAEGENDDEEEVEEEEEHDDEPKLVSNKTKADKGSVSKTTEKARPAKNELKGRRKMVFEPRPDWHLAELSELPGPSSDEIGPYMSAITSLKAHAKSLLEEDNTMYNTISKASSAQKFMSTIMSSGTISDRTSALTLAIQESPLHNLKALESLMTLGSKRNRNQALSALGALVDSLGPGTLLPSNRRLRLFQSQPGLIGTLQKCNLKTWSASGALPGSISSEHLISWAFEDWLKDSYFKVIQSLETWCDDEIEYSRTRSLDMVYALLKDKPEQESNLLRLLVNKLGDRERKIASRASYLLLQLLNIHPGMKSIMIRTVEQEIIFRPGQSIRTKYYAINTLNQTILTTKEPQVADSLLDIYFGLFVTLLKSGELGQMDAAETPAAVGKNKRHRSSGFSKNPNSAGPPSAADKTEQESAEKLTSAILTGINRAVPFSQADQTTLESHLNTLFRITHSSNFNTSIQALMLIQQVITRRHLAMERFYRTLYESLLDPRLITSSKQALYLNLLYRSLKSDVDVRRVKAFVKRMLQVLNLHQPSFACGILFLATELFNTFPNLFTLLTEPEDLFEETTGAATDAPENRSADSSRSKEVYDGRKRDPEYSNAHKSCLWEVLPFLRHFHPSVELYASSLLDGRKPDEKPDLASHTLINFLDKFVYKNPKASDGVKGHSLMQPVAATGQGAILVSGKASMKPGAAMNSAAFWNQKAENVAAEDIFFHEYFSQVGKPNQVKKRKANREVQDGDDDEEEENEDEIWGALTSSKPEIQGDDSESGMDSDFADLMADEEEESDMEDGMDVDDDDSGDDGEAREPFDLAEDNDDQDDVDADEDVSEGEDEPTESKKEKPESARAKRKKYLKDLPTFASAEDYAELMEKEDDV